MAKATKEVDLAEVLADSLNKQAKDQKVAFFLDNNDSPTNVEGWVSTGASMLDVAISNRPYGCLLYTSPSPRDRQKSRMPSSA